MTPISEPNYTLIAYRPSYVDTCMGCHMGTWSDEFEMEVNIYEDELATKWAKIIADAQFDSSPADTQIAVLKNGKVMYSSGYDMPSASTSDWLYSDEYCNLEEEEKWDEMDAPEVVFNREWEEFRALQQRAEDLAQERIKEKKADIKKKEDEKRAKEEAREQALRKKKFEELKKEFENGSNA